MAIKTWNQRLRGIIGSQLGADIVEYNIEKAIESAQSLARTGAKPMSKFYDPYSIFMGREWLAKAGSALTFTDLRMMAKNPIIGSIIQTRLNQVAAFCHQSNGSYEAGFQIKSNTGDGDSSKLSNKQAEVAKFVQTAGMSGYGDSNLEEYARKVIRDSLVMDQCCGEVVMRNNGIPAYMVAVDGSTIRRLMKSLQYVAGTSDPIYAQVIDEVVVAQYTKQQLMYGIRNPSTDIRSNGYGSSELEMLVNVVTTLANAEKYNSTSLAQGGTQKGLLVIKGDVDEPQLESFKRDFRSAIQNAAHTWKPPVLRIGPEANVDWVTLDRANKDMEYSQLFDFIVKLATGVYQISPDEVNWQVGQSGASVTYNSGVKDRLSYSQDKGLRPLLQFFAGHLNASVVSRVDPNLSLEFTGLGTSKTEEVELRTKEVGSFKTLNEVRADANLPPLEGGDVVLNPVLASMSTAKAALANAAALQAQQPQGASKKEQDPGADLQDTSALRKAVDIEWGDGSASY